MTDRERQSLALKHFTTICSLPQSERRTAADRLCGADNELRTLVERMLKADEGETQIVERDVRGFLEKQITDFDVTQKPAFEEGDQVDRGDGQYRILRVIGEGGMSTVYLAEQESPRRKVAIKAIRTGIRSASLRKRFEHEARLLSRMQHIGIARLYEADTNPTEPGVQAYLAMEYVDGQPIDEFAEVKQLDLRGRLHLFLKLCESIEYAHSMGVIHRDIKPANILVDSTGQPKVLDFGVAKAHAQNEAAHTQLTHHGQIIGTLTYMAPEQLDGKPDAVNASADVYALGVVLFKTLTQKLPIDVRQDPLLIAARRVQQDQPMRLSACSSSFESDLEAVVDKSLSKLPADRYPTVKEFAHDITAYLNGKPVSARKSSALGKIVRGIFGKRLN